MDREGEVTKGRVRKPITFLTNGTIAILLIIVMLLSVVEGYKHAVVACPEGSLYSFTADDTMAADLWASCLLIDQHPSIHRHTRLTGNRNPWHGLWFDGRNSVDVCLAVRRGVWWPR